MKYLRLALCLLCTIPLLASDSGLSSFAGTWRIDPGKTTTRDTAVTNPSPNTAPSPPPPPAKTELPPEQITVSGNVLKVSGGVFGTAVITIKPDGSQVADPIGDESPLVQMSRSDWNANSIVTVWKTQGSDGQTVLRGKDVRTLSSPLMLATYDGSAFALLVMTAGALWLWAGSVVVRKRFLQSRPG